MEHEIQRSIVLKLIHNPELAFNQLWDKSEDSNKFAYHLNRLEEQKLVEKSDGKYRLTGEGKKLSAFIEGDSGRKAEMPTLSNVMVVSSSTDNAEGKLLIQKRLKEPFYGYSGLVSGKINFGLNIIECAERDLLEETGLKPMNVEIKGMEQSKTYDNGKLLFHHYLILVGVKGVNGILKKSSHKAENSWFTYNELKEKEKTKDLVAGVIERVDIAFSEDKFTIFESERYMDNGKFVGFKIINKQVF